MLSLDLSSSSSLYIALQMVVTRLGDLGEGKIVKNNRKTRCTGYEPSHP
ncbi:unnamed protein product [Musa textilis]